MFKSQRLNQNNQKKERKSSKSLSNINSQSDDTLKDFQKSADKSEKVIQLKKIDAMSNSKSNSTFQLKGTKKITEEQLREAQNFNTAEDGTIIKGDRDSASTARYKEIEKNYSGELGVATSGEMYREQMNELIKNTQSNLDQRKARQTSAQKDVDKRDLIFYLYFFIQSKSINKISFI